MNREPNGLDLVKKLMADKRALEAPNVTCGSAKEREWWPPYAVNTEGKRK